MHTQKYTQPRFWLKYYQAEHFAIISEYIFCHKLLRNTTFFCIALTIKFATLNQAATRLI